VHQLKYRGWSGLGGPLGERIAGVAWPLEAHEPAVITPVPTTDRRRRERGYNQAELIAESFARTSSRDMRILLRRVSGSRTQTALQPAARAANVAGAFAPAAVVEGMHIILVDDVLTTGATALECARVLAEAGACCTRLITFVRAFDIRG
jgi:ComF family protein